MTIYRPSAHPYPFLPGELVKIFRTTRALNLTTGTYQNINRGRKGIVIAYHLKDKILYVRVWMQGNIFEAKALSFDLVRNQQTTKYFFEFVDENGMLFSIFSDSLELVWKGAHDLPKIPIAKQGFSDANFASLRMKLGDASYQIYPIVIRESNKAIRQQPIEYNEPLEQPLVSKREVWLWAFILVVLIVFIILLVISTNQS